MNHFFRAAVFALLLSAAVPLQAESFLFDKPGDLTQWKTELGKWSIVEHTLLQSDASCDYAIAWLPAKAYADFDLSVDFFVHPDGVGVRAPGIVYRAVDQQTLYYVHFDTRNQNILWVRSTAKKRGTDVRRHCCMDLKNGQWQTARLVVRGTQHQVYLDGKRLFVEKDTTLKAGVVGLRTGQGRVAFRNLRIEGIETELQPSFVVKAPFPILLTRGDLNQVTHLKIDAL